MYVNNFIASQRSLTLKAFRNFSTTIAIVAGSRSHDTAGARLMRKIKEMSNEDVKFIGVGGPEMLEAGLEKSYIDVNTFLDKPLVPYKNFLHAHVKQSFHPIMFPVHKANRNALKQLHDASFFSDVTKVRPQLFLTLGNQYFMRNFNFTLKDLYGLYDKVLPPLFHYDSLIINQRQEFEEYCDYWLYSNPREPVNWFHYKFPSTYVGSFSAARAIEYLYKSSNKTKHLVHENGLFRNKEYNVEITDALLEEERARFRQEHGLSNDTTLFYGLPGNTEAEIKWAVPLLANTVKAFLNKYSQYSPSNFAIVLPCYPTYQNLTIDEINRQNWPVKVIVVKSEQEKYSALAASDIGAVVNGDAVAECAEYHLPTVILNHTSFFQSYFTLLYNSFNNDLNITLNGEAYPECLGQAFPEKIAEYWGEWFEQPSKKYDIVERFRDLTLDLLPGEKGNQIHEKIETKELAEIDLPFEKYYDPEYLGAKKVLEAVKAYEAVNAEPKYYEVGKVRASMLSSILA